MNLGVSHARRSVAYQSIEEIINSKNSTVIGKFSCKGYDTYGPFKLVGGIAKGHPNEKDLNSAIEFYKKCLLHV